MNGKNYPPNLDDEARDSLLLDLNGDVGTLKTDMRAVLKAVTIDLPKRIDNAFDEALTRAAQAQLASIRRFRKARSAPEG